MAIDKSLNQAPLGIMDSDVLEAEPIEIEIEDPESVAIKAGGVSHKAVGKAFLELCEQAYDPSLQPKKPAAAPPPPQPTQDDFDDDIPF